MWNHRTLQPFTRNSWVSRRAKRHTPPSHCITAPAHLRLYLNFRFWLVDRSRVVRSWRRCLVLCQFLIYSRFASCEFPPAWTESKGRIDKVAKLPECVNTNCYINRRVPVRALHSMHLSWPWLHIHRCQSTTGLKLQQNLRRGKYKNYRQKRRSAELMIP